MALQDTPVRRHRPPSAAETGVRAGATDDSLRVTSGNWVEPPFNRWGFLHARELTRTARISRGPGPVRDLPSMPVELAGLTTTIGDEVFTVGELIDATYTDAMVVLHHGTIAFEHYDTGVRPDQPHLLMSVSKTLTTTLIGALVGDHVLSPDDLVVHHLPELAGSAWDGCTLQHLLDMRAGTCFSEDDANDPDSDGVLIDQVSGYITRRRDDLPRDTYEWIRGLTNDGPHGGGFRYRSILTDVLGWVVEAATGERFADVFAERIWQHLGAEHDADLIVDASGFPVVEGGISVTARDLARFGQMVLDRGRVGREQVVPAEWTDRVATRDDELIRTFADSVYFDPTRPQGCYHDGWWVLDADRGLATGMGIHGQQVLVDRASSTVIAKLSTWPKRIDGQLLEASLLLEEAILDRFSR